MILVDTSVWVEHFRGADRTADLTDLLEANEVLLHPWVLGELALGGVDRNTVLRDLQSLPCAPEIDGAEILELVFDRRLFGRGIGWVDSHLLASSLVAGSGFWTFDGRLAATAGELGIGVL